MRISTPLRVGVIGYGAIGRGVVDLIRERPDTGIEVVGVLVRNLHKYPRDINVVGSIDELLRFQPSMVVEVAGHQALRDFGPRVLTAGCDLTLASAGALADRDLEASLLRSALQGGKEIHVVSGAIGALDALSAAKVGGLRSVTHTTRKPPASLPQLPGMDSLSEPTEVFNGTVREGALRFPESINVAAAVALAGIGFDETRVCVVADPTIDRNVHEVRAEGAFGSFTFEIRNIATDENPRSARLVSMSVVSQLVRGRGELCVG